jgi:hypothetical protein
MKGRDTPSAGASLSRATAQGTPEDRTGASSSPEQLEAEAAAGVRGYERTMQARVEEAFPNKGDPIRLYGEGLAQGGVAFVRSMMKLTEAAESRLRRLLTTARDTAEAQVREATARTEADRAAAKVEAIQAVRAGLGEVVAAGRRARYGWAIGIAALGVAAAFGLGMLAEHWRGQVIATTAAADKLAQLSAAADKATDETTKASVFLAGERVDMGEAVADMRRIVAEATPGLSVLRTLGILPDAERTAMDGILDALAAGANGSKPSPQLQAVRALMALSPDARAQALEFARIGDARFRSAFLPVMRLAEERSKHAWWTGESVYPGCVTNGPALQIQGGGVLRTCLVRLPDNWTVPDALLRINHYGLPAG